MTLGILCKRVNLNIFVDNKVIDIVDLNKVLGFLLSVGSVESLGLEIARGLKMFIITRLN